MITKREIGNYLKFGFTEDLVYNEPYEIDYTLSFEDCINGYKELYENSINKIDISNAICALSGGLDSSLNIYYLKDKDPLVYSYIIEGNLDHIYAERLAKDWNLERFFLIDGVDLDKLEEDLINMNLLWDKPRCMTGDLHTYDAYVKTKEYSDLLISGVGSEPMSLGIGWMYATLLELAVMRHEYDTIVARKVFSKSKYFDPMHEEQFNLRRAFLNRHKTYSQLIKELFELGLFVDEDIIAMGLEPPMIQLREDTLLHALQATHDWYNPNMIGKRYPVLKEKLGVTFISPYADPELRKFCFSMPCEYRMCMGSERHVMRNFISEKLPQYIIDRPKEPFQPNIDWWFENAPKIEHLFVKYLKDKNKKIFNYLNYEATLNMLNKGPYKRWTLLNLSIWIETRKDI